MKVSCISDFFEVDLYEFYNWFKEFNRWKDLKIAELSEGNIRIFETYLVLKSNTKFCILDEPFTHLSPVNIGLFIELIRQEKEKKGIIITDHQYQHIKEVSDDLYIMNHYTTYAITNKDELKAHGYLK